MTALERTVGDSSAVDVLIVGGGITGAAIAYEAASRGYHTALVEQSDFGGSTSAATGKLIHGGLRYLKKLEVGLVRESLRERRILSAIAPNLVYPIPMVLPDPGLLEHLGLTAYDLLSFDRNRVRDASKRIPAHHSLSRRELDARGLDTMGSGILYYDSMMISPERLTLAFIRSAAAQGARIANYARVDRMLTEGSRVIGAVVTDVLTGRSTEVRARVVVNASGSWAHDVLRSSPATARVAGPGPAVRSEGIYLVTRKLSDTMVLYVSEHGHFSFAPWRGHSLVGPTEKSYRGPVSEWRLTRESIVEFIDSINAMSRLPDKLTIDDVVYAYGGLRPLTENTGEDTYLASRASESVDHAKDGVGGLITATGGKYTTSRAFAVKTFSMIQRKVGKPARRSISATAPLDGCDVGELQPFLDRAATASPGFRPESVDYLARHYGTDYPAVLDLARSDPALAEVLDADGELLAQVAYAIRVEMAQTLTDVFLRRTGLGTLGDPGEAVIDRAAGLAAAELGWSAQRREQEVADLRRAVSLPD